jgi:hypothetical protein
MRPVTAAAAAIAGLIKWVRAPRPWRPGKLRLDVEAHLSPGATMSTPFIATHMEHPGVRHSTPALIKMRSSPSASAAALTLAEPGTAIVGTATLRSFQIAAAARKSSMQCMKFNLKLKINPGKNSFFLNKKWIEGRGHFFCRRIQVILTIFC